MNCLIKDALCVLPEGLRTRNVGITEGKISFVSEREPEEYNWDRVISGKDKLLSPGLINAHGHLPMILMRGVADDCDLQHWLFEEIFPREDRLNGEMCAAGTRLAVAESLAGGCTSLSDMYFFSDDIARVCYDAGIKLNIARCISGYGEGQDKTNHPAYRQMEELLSRWHMADNGRIRVDVSPHAEYTTTPELWRDLGDFAKDHHLLVQTHISETLSEHENCVAKYGKTPTALFLEAGLLDTRLCAAHCVFVTEEDLEILLSKGAAVAHCPGSNAKLASGIAPVQKMLDKGIHVALGTDGASSNNSLSMLGEMKTAALVAKLAKSDPTALSAGKSLRLATLGGAYAQGREKECGAISVGMDADLVLFDLTKTFMRPRFNPVSALVYAAETSCVEMTMVRGRILYEKGEYTTIDMEKLSFETERMAALLQ